MAVARGIIRRWSGLIGLLASVACAPLPAPMIETAPRAPARESGCEQSPQSDPAIRSEDAVIRSLLVEGCEQSPTLQHLADAIGRTDGVVYISLGLCRIHALRGCMLHTIKDAGGARYLWIRIAANTDTRELVATMAHELQHALEVLSHPEIRSQRDVLDFYLSHDSGAYASYASPHRSYETYDAINIASMVHAEMLAMSNAAAAADDRD